MADSDCEGPINLGNPSEHTVLELADLVLEAADSHSRIEYRPLPTDDPTHRQPVITRAREQLGWSPVVPIEEGLERTVAWFADQSRRPDEASHRVRPEFVKA